MSTYVSKRSKENAKIVTEKKALELKDALKLIRQGKKTKFDQSVELQFKLGVDLTDSNQLVRGTTTLPHGRGKMPKVIVFSKDDSAKTAKEAGADVVGGDDLIEKVSGGWLDFDVAIATPAIMREIAKLGKVLGPRGLMPSPKAGTVTDNPAKAVKEIKSGRIEFKMDKQGNVHASIGKLSFDDQKIVDNGSNLITALLAARPKTLKGVMIKSAHISSTMGIGVRLDISKFLKETEVDE